MISKESQANGSFGMFRQCLQGQMDVLLLCHSSKGVTLGDGFRMVADDIAGGHLHRLADAPMIDLPAYAVYPVCIARTELVKEVPALFEYKVDLNEL